jgi:pimeloyl-ACP methyl ester carboxylesterase
MRFRFALAWLLISIGIAQANSGTPFPSKGEGIGGEDLSVNLERFAHHCGPSPEEEDVVRADSPTGFPLANQTKIAPIPAVTIPPAPMTFDEWKELERTDDYIEYDVTFPSALQSPYPVNDIVPLRCFLPRNAKGPVPVVLITHYWGARDLRAEVSLATDLAAQGIGSAIMTLPYHLSRAPLGSRSGDLAIQPDPEKLKATLTQSVLDMRRSLDFLTTRREFRHDQFGLAGTSLGAIVSSLAYAVEPRFQYASFLLGGVNLAHVLWNSSRVVAQRDILRRKGLTEAKLRTALSEVEPTTYLANRKTGATFIIGARYDTVIPADSTENLIRSMPNPQVLTLNTGHYGGIFVQRRIIREIARFFSTSYIGESFVPPLTIYAPTIRLALKLDYPTGFDLAAGLDLLRLKANGSAFATFFLTPRGPQIWAGQTISNGFSIGVSGSLRSLGIGIMWSTVL